MHLKKLAGAIEAGDSLEGLAAKLAASGEFKSQFKGRMTQEAKIARVLNNLGLQAGTEAYEDAFEFFNERMNDGVNFG